MAQPLRDGEASSHPAGGAPMQAWLRCSVSPGQFPDEYAIGGEKFDGRPFSLFAPLDTVQLPVGVTSGEGLIRVTVSDRKGDLVLVRLPGQTFENGYFITVKADQLVNGATPAGARG
jgi:hypothetical protein